VADVEIIQQKRNISPPEREVRSIGQVVVLPSMPFDVERLGKKKNGEEKTIIEREDSKCSSRVERLEIMRDVERLDENTGDKKTGERKEKINATVGRAAYLHDEVQDTRTSVVVAYKQMVDKNKKDRESANAIEGWNVGETAGILLIGGMRNRGGPRLL
jgi:hypothetical protein